MVKKRTLKLIGVEEGTKEKLDNLKDYPRETYDDIILKLIELKGGKKE
tara:strand:- start:325 stop:468 length:144 start_codon:yes stop_codon:yes gene_type:complete